MNKSPISDEKRPLIGVAPCARLDAYRDAIRHSGGEPVVLDYAGDPPESVVARCGGILLPGGRDIDPVFFDEPAHPTFAPSEPGRDEYELALLRAAAAADIPVFAICRGMQVLNVAHGGTLIQDIPDLLPGAQPHSVDGHPITVHPGTRLQQLLAAAGLPACVDVNSRHHQAVGRLGAGLTACATAADSLVEAIERPAARFCLGVQWHPEESMEHPVSRALFSGFVNAALLGHR